MSITTIHIRLAITRTSRHPYFRVRVLARSDAQPGELVVPIALRIDDQLLRRETNRVWIEAQSLDAATGKVEGS